MEEPGRGQNLFFTGGGRIPTPMSPGASWGFKKHWGGNQRAAIPTRLLGTGQKNTLSTGLGILCLHPAGGAGKGVDRSVSCPSWGPRDALFLWPALDGWLF